MAAFTGTLTPPNPQDQFLGADDVADSVRVTPATLDAADTVRGGSGEVVDTLRLTGRHFRTATTQAGLVVIGDPTLASSLTLRGNNQSAFGGCGADTLQASAGLVTRLEGGDGSDSYVTGPAEQTTWDTPGRIIADTAKGTNALRISGAGSLSIDFEEHPVSFIGRIIVTTPSPGQVSLTLTDAMLGTADGDANGLLGDIFILALSSVTTNVLIDGGNLIGSTGGIAHSIVFNQSFHGADTVTGFGPGDRLLRYRSGLGLGSGGVVAVPANRSWNIGNNAVLLFESDSANSDTLNSNAFADLTAIAFAMNTDNGLGTGSFAGRTVALAISNPEAVRRTGLYLRTDSDGDSLLEAGDVVRLLAVLHGVTANQPAAGSALQIYG